MENIGQSNSGDQFYRYKRPKLVARIEGRGNGIKTNAVNLVDVSKALERPTEYVLKFFGCELGAQTKFSSNSGTCIVNGAHEVSVLNELLEKFTKKYVQCHSCGNPETRIRIRKGDITLQCKACGSTSDVDMRHKLNTFILKNPPEDKVSKAEKRLKKMEDERMKEASGDALDREAKEAKAKRKKEREAKKAGKKVTENGDGNSPTASHGSQEEDDDDEDDQEVEWMADVSEEAVKARAAEQLSGATSEMVTQGNIEAEQAEQRRADKARKKEEKAAAAAAAEAQAKADADAAKAHQAKVEADAAAAQQKADEEAARLAELKVDKSSGNGDEDVAFVDALRELVTAPSYSAKKATVRLNQLGFSGGLAERAKLLYMALFANLGDYKLGPAIEARAEVLIAEAGDDASKQVAQLVALEYLLVHVLPGKIKQTAIALKALYEEEIVVEDVMLAWYEKAGAAKVLAVDAEDAARVRTAAEPFITWLQEASDEEDSDDE